LGGGQLGRMLALAGHRLGIHVRCLDPSPEACAGQVTELVVGKYEDPSALLTLIKGADVVTYESENIPVDVLEYIGARGTRVHPCHQALAQFQDRLSEKKLAQELGCRTVTFADMEPLFEGDLDGALATVGLPAIIKTRRLGYDGKSQCRIATRADAGSAMVMLGGLKEGANLIAEERLEFDYEASLIAIAPLEGDPIFYPLTVNVHHDGILHTSRTARGAETWL
jgi:5-(carboxyamino)imidazole ribonucleotide synthase